MRNILTSAILIVCFSITVLGQNFTISPNPVRAGKEASTYDITAYSFITNNESVTVTYRWKRIKNVTNKDWTSAICDINTCYAPTVDSADFDLTAGQTGPLQGHFYPDNVVNIDTIIVIVFKVSDFSDIDTCYFYAAAAPNGIMSISKNSIIMDGNIVDSNYTAISTVTNNDATNRSYKIKEITISTPGGWTTSLDCGVNPCTDTTTFSLTAGSNIDFNAILNSKGITGDGYVNVSFYPVDYSLYVDSINFNLRAWPTSLTEPITNSAPMKIYPNPAREFISIEMKDLSKVKAINVYNILGQPVKQVIAPKTNIIQFSLDGLPDGLYFIEYQDQNGNLFTKQLIKSSNFH
ncbi:T9SS type A sorting domain-containing protein [Candidatus Amoebophilus asiaticus]|nr:T9SS type A sorting domain-containing protein [Candidatus Amoebophilus asiaticus]